MADLTLNQARVAEAYGRAFPNSPDTTLILDDVQQMIGGMLPEHQTGAMKLMLYVMLKRSLPRRLARAKEK